MMMRIHRDHKDDDDDAFSLFHAIANRNTEDRSADCCLNPDRRPLLLRCHRPRLRRYLPRRWRREPLYPV